MPSMRLVCKLSRDLNLESQNSSHLLFSSLSFSGKFLIHRHTIIQTYVLHCVSRAEEDTEKQKNTMVYGFQTQPHASKKDYYIFLSRRNDSQISGIYDFWLRARGSFHTEVSQVRSIGFPVRSQILLVPIPSLLSLLKALERFVADRSLISIRIHLTIDIMIQEKYQNGAVKIC